MGIDGLLKALKKVLEECTKGMLLKVNPDTGDHEEDYELPMEPGSCEEETEDGETEAEELPRPKQEPPRPPHIFLMNLPERQDTISQIPYLIIQAMTGKDKNIGETKDEQAVADVGIVIATYNDDGEDGGMQVLEIIERIRIMLEKGRLLGQSYMLQLPFEWEVYTDDTGAYYLGEIVTHWSVPTIERTELFIEDVLGKE